MKKGAQIEPACFWMLRYEIIIWILYSVKNVRVRHDTEYSLTRRSTNSSR